MGKPNPIPAEFKKERIQVLHTISLDKLLADTLTSQFSYTNITWGLIALALDEYLFLREKEMVAKSGAIEPLTSPMHLESREFLEARDATRENLEQEFREQFCLDPPNGRIEWEKLGEFLKNKMPIKSES